MKDKVGKFVALLIGVAALIFMKMSGPLPQPLAEHSHTIIIEMLDPIDQSGEKPGETIFVLELTDDLVLMPDESSPAYQEELANAKKAMQNP